MNSWFTTQKLDDATYAISEYSHWEQVHSYLLLGTKGALLIDSGLGVANIHEIVQELTSLPVKVITTHVHWDHIGGHGLFKDVMVHEEELHWVNGGFPLSLAMVKNELLKERIFFPKNFDADGYTVFQRKNCQTYANQQLFDIGNRKIIAHHTPGHSPGHCCFFEPERGYLFSGDLIYQGPLAMYYPTTDPMAFWQSIQKMDSLLAHTIWPGHYKLPVEKNIVTQINQAFQTLHSHQKLYSGSGLHGFGSFSLHL